MLKNKKSNNKDNKDIILLDITTKSVKAIYAVPGEKKLIAKGIAALETKPNSDENILENAIKEASVQADKETGRAIVGLGGPNVFGFLLILKIRRKNPDNRISSKEMDQFYARIKDFAYAQAQKMRGAFFADDVELENLDLVVTNFMIDDKPVSDPVDQVGEFLQISTYTSYSSKDYYDSLQGELRNLDIEPQAVTTTLYSQVKILNKESANFLLIDVGKTYTDLAVVFGKNIVQTRSFDLGGDFFTSYLVDKLGLPPKDATGKKEAYSLGTLNAESVDSVSDLLYEAGKSWRTALCSVLESMTGIKSFPKKIYLTGGSAFMEILEELLYEEGWKNSVPFSGEIEVMKPNEEVLGDYLIDDLMLVNGPRMFVPASLSIIYTEIEKEDEISN